MRQKKTNNQNLGSPPEPPPERPPSTTILATAPNHERDLASEKEPEEKSPLEKSKIAKSYDVSVRAVKGGRLTMEDEYFIAEGGRFAAVYDGHGGGDVSLYLRHNLHRRILQQLKKKQDGNDSSSSVPTFVSALREAFDLIDSEVMASNDMQYQGSTAVAVAIHEASDGSRTLLSANVGDSRAVLCRDGETVQLTRDHKPNDEREKARIMGLGERIEWDNYCKVHRVRNLSLSRAIGDRFAKPVVSGQVEIKRFPLKERGDEFIVLASDGLWDVMTSEQVVKFVRKKMELIPGALEKNDIHRLKYVRRKNMSRYVANEALRRGSGDNVCVVVIWLQTLDWKTASVN